jgi:hypothetical protein
VEVMIRLQSSDIDLTMNEYLALKKLGLEYEEIIVRCLGCPILCASTPHARNQPRMCDKVRY